MKIETIWLSNTEASLAIPMLINAKDDAEDITNDTMGLYRIDNFNDGYEVMDFINAIDDGYYPDEYNPHQGERDKYAKEIEEIIGIGNNEDTCHYAFFIRNYFCGFISFSE